MWRAGQTPHGARPNREGPRVRLRTCRLGASQPPGRSLEPRSNARPRGMTVLPEQSGRQNSAYRSGCQAFSRKVLRLRSGFRQRAPVAALLTPAKRLNLQVQLPTILEPTSGKTARRGAADTITSERFSRLFALMPQLLQAVKMWDSECPSPLG